MQIDGVASLYSFKTAYLNSKLRKQKGEAAVGAEILPSFTGGIVHSYFTRRNTYYVL